MRNKRILEAVSIFILFTTLQLQFLGNSSEAATPKPILVSKVNPRASDINFYPWGVLGSSLYFGAENGSHDSELWISDGTPKGTHLVKITNLKAGSEPIDFMPLGSKMLFSANDGASKQGKELWVTDGTNKGTKLLKDIAPNSLEYAVLGKKIIFDAFTKSGGDRLWSTDGTPAGTQQVEDSNGAGVAIPRQLTKAGSKIYFLASEANGTKASDEQSDELWVSDGSSIGTHVVLKTNPTGEDSASQLQLIGSDLYFRADDGNGVKTWVSDGTPTNTQLLSNLIPGFKFANDLIALGQKIAYFTFDLPNSQADLWISDGTPSGTILVKKINFGGLPTVKSIISTGTRIFFQLGDPSVSLWTSDGTSDGTQLVMDGLSPFSRMVNIANFLIFTNRDPLHGLNLYATNESTLETHLIKLLNPNGQEFVAFYSKYDVAEIGDTLYFTVYQKSDDYLPKQLWSTQGTAASTKIIQDFSPIVGGGNSNSGISELTVVGSTLFFALGNNPQNFQLWKMLASS